MQTPVHTIVKTLFHRDSLEEVSEEQLQDYIRMFPYSSIGHLLLARKRKEQGDDYKHASATASLYVSNPLWLHCFLGTNGPVVQEHTSAVPASTYTGGLIPETSPSAEEAVVEEISAVVEKDEPAPAQAAEAVDLSNPVSETPPAPPQAENFVEQTFDAGPAKQEDLVSESTVVENEVVFEPYHTIDYFASQGIKLKAEDLTKDKLGRQLKSFTDWLRTMKRIAPVSSETVLATETPDLAVVKKAEESVETSDVETEAMAEVWIKQGKPARAIAIYHKLSLLNPSKSHYFAAKIEQLNA